MSYVPQVAARKVEGIVAQLEVMRTHSKVLGARYGWENFEAEKREHSVRRLHRRRLRSAACPTACPSGACSSAPSIPAQGSDLDPAAGQVSLDSLKKKERRRGGEKKKAGAA